MVMAYGYSMRHQTPMSKPLNPQICQVKLILKRQRDKVSSTCSYQRRPDDGVLERMIVDGSSGGRVPQPPLWGLGGAGKYNYGKL